MFFHLFSNVLNSWKRLVDEKSVKGQDGGGKASRGKYLLGLLKLT